MIIEIIKEVLLQEEMIDELHAHLSNIILSFFLRLLFQHPDKVDA